MDRRRRHHLPLLRRRAPVLGPGTKVTHAAAWDCPGKRWLDVGIEDGVERQARIQVGDRAPGD